MNVRLITAGELDEGMVLDRWAQDHAVQGKAVEKVFRNGANVTVEFIDGTTNVVPHYVAVFVREPQWSAQKDLVMALFESKDGKTWRNAAGNRYINELHVPLGWVPLSWVDVLRELLNEGKIEIREIGDAAYLVKREIKT